MDPSLKAALQRAVIAGDFLRGRRLWEEYVAQCRQEMQQGPDPKGKLEEAGRLMEWCRQMALAARAQAQARLDNLAYRTRVAAAYGHSETHLPRSIRAIRY